jgi:hypothetical protein
VAWPPGGAVSADRGAARASTLNGVPGTSQKRRPTLLPGPSRRRCGLPARAAAEPAKLDLEPRLGAVVEEKLAVRWSPQQIAGWLPLAYPQDPVMRVSHETI